MKPISFLSFYFVLICLATASSALSSDRGYLVEELLATGDIFVIEQDSTILILGTTSSKITQTVITRSEYFHPFILKITYEGKTIKKWNIEEEGHIRLVDAKKTSDNGIVLLIRKLEDPYLPPYYTTLVIKLNESMNIEWKFFFGGFATHIFENNFGDLLVFWKNWPERGEPHAIALKKISSLGKELSTHVIYESMAIGFFIVNNIDSLNSNFSIIFPKTTRDFYKPINMDRKSLQCSVPVIKRYGLRLDEPISEHNYLLLLINEYGETLYESCFNLFDSPGKTHYNEKHNMYLSQGKFLYLNREKIDHSKPFFNLREAEEYTSMISTLNGDGSFIKSLNIETHGETEPFSLHTIKLNDNEYLMFYAHRLGNRREDILLYKYDIIRGVITGSHILEELPADNAQIYRLDAFVRNDENLVIVYTQGPIGRLGGFRDVFLHTIKMEDINWEP